MQRHANTKTNTSHTPKEKSLNSDQKPIDYNTVITLQEKKRQMSY